jgi:hypothetical protein
MIRTILMKNNLLRLASVLFFITINQFNAYSQWGGFGDESSSETSDSTNTDSNETSSEGFGWGSEEETTPKSGTPAVPLKPYERVKDTPLDSITKRITYSLVVEDDSCNYCTPDSLYYRAKQYLLKKYGDGKKFPKKIIVEDVTNERIILNVRVPMVVQVNPSSKQQIGEYSFNLQLRVKDFRYKYKFTDFIHHEPVTNGKPTDFNSVYMEYYLNNKVKVRETDKFLMAIDRDMKELIEGLVKVMKDPVTVDVDEDDF